MRIRSLILLILCIIALSGAGAAGFLLPSLGPRLSVKSHAVTVTIDGQVATTEIDQVFHSNATRPMEGTYIFPIPEGASITKFTLRADGEDLPARTLARGEARRIYNGIVQQKRDPALLEWLGARMMQARVFPILPGEDKRIRITYQEVLAAQNGVVQYRYPLKTEKLSATPLERCSVTVTMHSAQPIRSVGSPSHGMEIRREGERTAVARYTASHVRPDEDLLLYYTVSQDDLGMHVLTYADPERGDGYFLLLAAPKTETRREDVQPKDIIFVLDTSGSMAKDRKLQQAKEALKYCLHRLDPRDRFSVVAFSTKISAWQTSLQSASPQHRAAAGRFIDGLKARHNTNIDGALRSALDILKTDGDSSRVRDILFLTDGLPTDGETKVERILANMRQRNTVRARLFDFGVGYDYNAHFLDQLADQNKGEAVNVLPNEGITAKISGLYDKIALPLLTDLTLDFGSLPVYDQYPPELPDLYQGSQLVVVGRYTPSSAVLRSRIRLSGMMGGTRRSIAATNPWPARALENDFIPRLWATRRIGYLEDRMRLEGGDTETLAEIIRLSKEFGILTEYTSFLVDMDASQPVPIANAVSAPVDALARNRFGYVREQAGVSIGDSAVAQSLNRKQGMKTDQYAPYNGNYVSDARGARVQMGQMRNISQRSFVQSGPRWVDVHYTPTQRSLAVKAFSPAYYQLANAHPRMAQCMSLGAQVTVSLRDEAIEVGDSGQEVAFAPEELQRLTEEINRTFGEPYRMRAAGLPVAMTPVHTRLPAWGWGLALLMVVAGGVTLYRARKGRHDATLS